MKGTFSPFQAGPRAVSPSQKEAPRSGQLGKRREWVAQSQGQERGHFREKRGWK